MSVPVEPKIYHITHVRNLPLLLEAKRIWSDAKRLELIALVKSTGRRSKRPTPEREHQGRQAGGVPRA